MKSKIQKYENVKSKLYHNVLAIIGGGIILWVVLYFSPMESFLSLAMSISNSNIDAVIATFFTVIIAAGVIFFSFGFYGVKYLINIICQNNMSTKKDNQTEQVESEGTV